MKNAIKREFQRYGGKFWENLGSWRTLTFSASGATQAVPKCTKVKKVMLTGQKVMQNIQMVEKNPKIEKLIDVQGSLQVPEVYVVKSLHKSEEIHFSKNLMK